MNTYCSDASIINIDDDYSLIDWIHNGRYTAENDNYNHDITNKSYLQFISSNTCDFIVDEEYYNYYRFYKFGDKCYLHVTDYEGDGDYPSEIMLAKLNTDITELMDCKDEPHEVILGNIELLTNALKQYVDIISSFEHIRIGRNIKSKK